MVSHATSPQAEPESLLDSNSDSAESEPVSPVDQPLRYVKEEIRAELRHLDISPYIAFSKRKLIGNGTFGDVYKTTFTPPERVSMKVVIKCLRVFMGVNLQDLFEKEIYVWSKLKHDNVLPFLGYAIQPTEGYPILVSEWMKKGSAWNYVKNQECNLTSLVIGIVKGLEYLHRQNVIHSDIKPQNIVVTDSGNACICDFGTSRIIAATMSFAQPTISISGTVRYHAYELVIPGLNKGHTKKTDVWALGMTIFALLTREHPYANLKEDYHIAAAISGKKLPELPQSTENWTAQMQKAKGSFWNLCKHCWNHDPAERADMPFVLETLLSETNSKLEADCEGGTLPQYPLQSTPLEGSDLLNLAPGLVETFQTTSWESKVDSRSAEEYNFQRGTNPFVHVKLLSSAPPKVLLGSLQPAPVNKIDKLSYGPQLGDEMSEELDSDAYSTHALPDDVRRVSEAIREVQRNLQTAARVPGENTEAADEYVEVWSKHVSDFDQITSDMNEICIYDLVKSYCYFFFLEQKKVSVQRKIIRLKKLIEHLYQDLCSLFGEDAEKLVNTELRINRLKAAVEKFGSKLITRPADVREKIKKEVEGLQLQLKQIDFKINALRVSSWSWGSKAANIFPFIGLFEHYADQNSSNLFAKVQEFERQALDTEFKARKEIQDELDKYWVAWDTATRECCSQIDFINAQFGFIKEMWAKLRGDSESLLTQLKLIISNDSGEIPFEMRLKNIEKLYEGVSNALDQFTHNDGA